MRVSCLAQNSHVMRDRFDAASHFVMQSMGLIHSYLDQIKKYDQRLGRKESTGICFDVRKVRWTLIEAVDMETLRESIHRRNTGLQLLQQCAGLYETLSHQGIDHTANPLFREINNAPSVLSRVTNELKKQKLSAISTIDNTSAYKRPESRMRMILQI